jgi:hypothetical protein
MQSNLNLGAFILNQNKLLLYFIFKLDEKCKEKK